MSIHDPRYRELFELSLVPGVGIYRLKNLLQKFGTCNDVFKASLQDLILVDGIDEILARNILHRDDLNKFIDDQFEQFSKTNSQIITLWDDDYPTLLKNIYDPPPFLFFHGELNFKNIISIAIVGTRSPTHYGKKIAEDISTSLAENGITVISGLARGIDTIAHNFALKSKGKTIAVLGTGLDIIYPSENNKLAEMISENGAVVSEFYFGTKPDSRNFPRRNRIISGLSNGVVLVESSIKGGAMITARYAIDQNRDVFCVPGNVTSQFSTGTNLLIKQSSAKLIQNGKDILDEYFISSENSKIKIEQVQQLSIFEQKIFEILSNEPIHIDSISENLSIPIAETHVHLLNLEFKSLIRQLPGKYFVRDI